MIMRHDQIGYRMIAYHLIYFGNGGLIMPEKTWDLVYDAVIDLHKSVISLGKSVTSIEGKVDALSVRMDSLEGKVNLGFVSLRNEMNI